MRTKYIVFLGFLLAIGTLISVTFGGAWLDSTDVDVVNTLTVFKEANILDTWTITLPNTDFFFTGFKALTMLDFAFFTGPLVLVQWFMFMTVIVGALWGVYIIIITVVTSALRR